MVITASLLLVMLAPAIADDGPQLNRSLSKADCVLAVYVEDWSYAPQHGPRLILGLWKDGHIVWSLDQVRGGPPYRSGEIGSSELRKLLANIDERGVFDDPKLAWSWVPIDSDFTTILARFSGREGVLRSRHEIEEAMGRVTLHNTPEFRRFMSVWKEIRRRAALLIPEKSVTVQGELVLLRGDMTWRERAQ